MKQGPVLGLAGLFLTGAIGCELHRPCCGRCLLARDGYAQSEMGYRPKTVVTMRAETLPETTVAGDGTPAVQLVNASTTSAASSGGATPAGSGPMVTIMIPAMKIVVPMNTANLNKAPAAFSSLVAATQLPPVSGASSSSSSRALSPVSSTPAPLDKEIRTAVHTQGEEAVSSQIASPPPSPDPAPESKLVAPTESPNKKAVDPLRPSKLSRLPPDPPEVSGRVSTDTSSDPALDIPPPPPILRKSSEGPSLPQVDPGPK